MSSVEFIRDLLVNQLQIKKLVIGYNHHFGRNREGSLEHLLECGPVYGFDVEEIPAADIDNVNISSTKIRKALNNGDLSTAKSYLGHDYSLAGEVVKGERRGTDIGYPTANIQIDNPIKLIPANGVYAVYITVSDTQYPAMMNIGVRPTVTENSNSPDRTIEINIFDFDQDIYGEPVRVTMVERIRDEAKFDSVKELAIQLADDKESALNLLNKN